MLFSVVLEKYRPDTNAVITGVVDVFAADPQDALAVAQTLSDPRPGSIEWDESIDPEAWANAPFRVCAEIEPTPAYQKSYPILDAIHWDLYRESLADALLDAAADESDCPDAITESAWTGTVKVDDNNFLVVLHQGEE